MGHIIRPAIREHAKEWGINPRKIGIMGASAGGHLVSTAVTHFTSDDATVPCEQSIRYFEALNANKVSASLHIYPTGKHGWGYKDSFTYKHEWTSELEKWLKEINK
jgi:acetyl esterase/lipase